MGLEAKNDTVLALTHKNVAQKLNALSTKKLPHDYIAATTSHNTRRAYQSDIRYFKPTDPERRLTALKNWHCYQGFANPTAHATLRKTLIGIKNTHGKPHP